MLRGIYSSATSMLTQRNRLDVIANNLANVTTNGYKSDELISRSFEDLMLERINDTRVVGKYKEVGPLNTGIHVDSVVTHFSMGSPVETGKTTDAALSTDGFFTVQTPQGVRYTRDGAFALTGDGLLVTQDGNPVLGEYGEIYVESSDFQIKENGEVWQNGEFIDKLRITDFEDYKLLRKEGGNLYQNTGSAEKNVEKTELHQGYVEGSNVDVMDNIVDMIKVYRNYEANQKMIQTMDSTLGKAVELGKI